MRMWLFIFIGAGLFLAFHGFGPFYLIDIDRDAIAYEASSSTNFFLHGGGLDSIAKTGSSSTSFIEYAAGGQAIIGRASSSASFISLKGIIYPMFRTFAAADTMTFTIDAGSWINFTSITISQRIANLTTRLKVDTNSADGWTVTAGRDHVGAGILYSRGDGTEINDTSTGINTAANVPTCNAENWPTSVDISSGLGFTVWASDTKYACWGTGTTVSDANNKYAAFPASASPAKIVGDTNAVPNPSYHSVGYSLEVLNTQKATSYEGDVIFSATTSPP